MTNTYLQSSLHFIHFIKKNKTIFKGFSYYCYYACCKFRYCECTEGGLGELSQYSDWLQAARSGDRIPGEAWFSAPVQTSPGAHPASCTMGTEFFPGVKSSQGMTLTPQPLLVPCSWKSRAIPLFPLWAIRPVQSLSACTRMHCTLYLSAMKDTPPRRYPYFDVVVGLEWSQDPESYAGGSVNYW
jgi:hypothetical protein